MIKSNFRIMRKFLKLNNNHGQYEVFVGSEDFVRPNVSYCREQKCVHYNPRVATVKAIIRAQSTESDFILTASENTYVPPFEEGFTPVDGGNEGEYTPRGLRGRNLYESIDDFYKFSRDSFTMENYEYSEFSDKIPVAV